MILGWILLGMQRWISLTDLLRRHVSTIRLCLTKRLLTAERLINRISVPERLFRVSAVALPLQAVPLHVTRIIQIQQPLIMRKLLVNMIFLFCWVQSSITGMWKDSVLLVQVCLILIYLTLRLHLICWTRLWEERQSKIMVLFLISVVWTMLIRTVIFLKLTSVVMVLHVSDRTHVGEHSLHSLLHGESVKSRLWKKWKVFSQTWSCVHLTENWVILLPVIMNGRRLTVRLTILLTEMYMMVYVRER